MNRRLGVGIGIVVAAAGAGYLVLVRGDGDARSPGPLDAATAAAPPIDASIPVVAPPPEVDAGPPPAPPVETAWTAKEAGDFSATAVDVAAFLKLATRAAKAIWKDAALISLAAANVDRDGRSDLTGPGLYGDTGANVTATFLSPRLASATKLDGGVTDGECVLQIRATTAGIATVRHPRAWATCADFRSGAPPDCAPSTVIRDVLDREQLPHAHRGHLQFFPHHSSGAGSWDVSLRGVVLDGEKTDLSTDHHDRDRCR